jgi:hypothetical protein
MANDSVKRSAALAVLGLRVVYGAGLIAAPAPLARRWLGPGAESAPVQVPLRALGVREIVGDIAWTALGRQELPSGDMGATAVVAGASAALSAGVAASMDG